MLSYDSGVVRFIVADAAPDGDIDEAALGALFHHTRREFAEVREVEGHVEFGVAKVRRMQAGEIDRGERTPGAERNTCREEP